ncbi:hypothetical protein ACO1HB_02620 [Alteromonas macleodii]|uniref:hypothetical protein n=1 Tax=Alteromonas macleodii TaxID=28108 RepID=UPI003BF83EF1
MDYGELFIGAILGAIGSHFFTKFADKFTAKFSKRVKDKKLKKYLKKYDSELEKNVIAIDHAAPLYRLENIELTIKKEHFFLSTETALIEELTKLRFKLNSLNVFGDKLAELERSTNINGLSGLIDHSSVTVANELVEKIRQGHIRFNGKLFGVRRAFGGRTPEDEEATLKIEFYETDYFTYLVMNDVYSRLKNSGFKFYFANSFVSLRRYYPFMPSFGLACFTIFDRGNGEEVLLCHRSEHLEAFPNNWHFSMNEALSLKDLDSDKIEKTPSFKTCLFRGLKEELGIEKTRVKEFGFMDFWLGTERCELGILSYAKIKIDKNYSFDDFLKAYSIAQDSELETQNWRLEKVKEIPRFVEDNSELLSAPCKKGLEYLSSRYNAGYLKEQNSH